MAKPDFKWLLEAVEAGAAEEWLMSASPPGCYLLAVEMKGDFAGDTTARCATHVRSSVYRARQLYHVYHGRASCQTWRVAQARAEAIWHIAVNIRSEHVADWLPVGRSSYQATRQVMPTEVASLPCAVFRGRGRRGDDGWGSVAILCGGHIQRAVEV